jgi:hypothetical protein
MTINTDAPAQEPTFRGPADRPIGVSPREASAAAFAVSVVALLLTGSVDVRRRNGLGLHPTGNGPARPELGVVRRRAPGRPPGENALRTAALVLLQFFFAVLSSTSTTSAGRRGWSARGAPRTASAIASPGAAPPGRRPADVVRRVLWPSGRRWRSAGPVRRPARGGATAAGEDVVALVVELVVPAEGAGCTTTASCRPGAWSASCCRRSRQRRPGCRTPPACAACRPCAWACPHLDLGDLRGRDVTSGGGQLRGARDPAAAAVLALGMATSRVASAISRPAPWCRRSAARSWSWCPERGP